MADQGGSNHGIARTSRTRTEEQRQKDLERIKDYRGLEDQVRAHATKNDYSPDVFALTSKLLRLNPEYYTVWNVRRRCLISGLLSKPSPGSSLSKASPTSSPTATTTTSSADFSSSLSTETPPAPESQTTGKSGTTAEEDEEQKQQTRQQDQQNDQQILQKELHFTIPLLLESPKCYWIWSYRLWILKQVIERLPVPVARKIWEEELGLTSKMLLRDQRNFHAWGYRRHVVEQLESPELEGKSLVESEFEFTTKKIEQNLSNFSAWHSRSKLIPRLLDERNADDEARKAFFEEELGKIGEAINVGPDDQSLWYYHQFLMLNLVNFVGHPTITPAFTQEERVTYLQREIEGIQELLEDYDDAKLIYEALFDYTLYLCQLQERKPNEQEEKELKGWLGSLKMLDPMRSGRWADLERDLGLRGVRVRVCLM